MLSRFRIYTLLVIKIRELSVVSFRESPNLMSQGKNPLPAPFIFWVNCIDILASLCNYALSKEIDIAIYVIRNNRDEM